MEVRNLSSSWLLDHMSALGGLEGCGSCVDLLRAGVGRGKRGGMVRRSGEKLIRGC